MGDFCNVACTSLKTLDKRFCLCVIYSLLQLLLQNADVAQLVEHHLAKVRVAGSSPVIRSVSDFRSYGGLAERRGSGLQSRIHGFESRTHLALGRLAQRERASLTRKRSLVRSQYRPLFYFFFSSGFFVKMFSCCEILS